jgi:hypothetical protein
MHNSVIGAVIEAGRMRNLRTAFMRVTAHRVVGFAIFKAWAIILAVIIALKLIAHRFNEWEDWVKIIEALFLAECGILTFLAVLKWAWIAVFAH